VAQDRADSPDLLLSVEPENMQAQSLRSLIERAVTRDGYIGMYFLFPFFAGGIGSRYTGVGIIAGAAAVTGIVLTAVFKRTARR
jgi:fission 1 protein